VRFSFIISIKVMEDLAETKSAPDLDETVSNLMEAASTSVTKYSTVGASNHPYIFTTTRILKKQGRL
jgi:hypothetical protein